MTQADKRRLPQPPPVIVNLEDPVNRKKLALTVAVAMLMFPSVAHAGLTDDYYVKKIGIAFAASGMCGFDTSSGPGFEILGYLGNHAVQSTGASVYAIEFAAKAYAMQVYDRVMTNGTKIQFCQNIYNGKW